MGDDYKEAGESLGKCAVCGAEAGVLYPLLPNEPAFCSEHHNPKDAGSFGCDFTGPDDFDIPIEDDFFGFHSVGVSKRISFNRKTFVWTDKEGNRHKLKDIEEPYLQNIISFLRRRLAEMDETSVYYWRQVVVFLEREQSKRERLEREELVQGRR